MPTANVAWKEVSGLTVAGSAIVSGSSYGTAKSVETYTLEPGGYLEFEFTLEELNLYSIADQSHIAIGFTPIGTVPNYVYNGIGFYLPASSPILRFIRNYSIPSSGSGTGSSGTNITIGATVGTKLRVRLSGSQSYLYINDVLHTQQAIYAGPGDPPLGTLELRVIVRDVPTNGFETSNIVIGSTTQKLFVGSAEVSHAYNTIEMGISEMSVGGFVETYSDGYNSNPRTRPTAPTDLAYIPTKGRFSVPAPYGSTVFRLTNSTDATGQGINALGYSYWNNINAWHLDDDHRIYVFAHAPVSRGGVGLGLWSFARFHPTGDVIAHGNIFTDSRQDASGEGWFFSATEKFSLITITDDGKIQKFNADPNATGSDASKTTTIFDIRTKSGTVCSNIGGVTTISSNDRIWQISASSDMDVFAGTVRNNSYATKGLFFYRVSTDTFHWYTPIRGGYDECQISKDGRWLISKEDAVDDAGGASSNEDNVIYDTLAPTTAPRILSDYDGAGGHSDTGHGYMIAADNWSDVNGNWVNNAIRRWNLSPTIPLTKANAPLVHRSAGPSMDHASFCHSKPTSEVPIEDQFVVGSNLSTTNTPLANEIFAARLDGSFDVLVISPSFTSTAASGGGSGAAYTKFPYANTDRTGRYVAWVSNMCSSRMDLFVAAINYEKLLLEPPVEPEPEPDPVYFVEDFLSPTSRTPMTFEDIQTLTANRGAFDFPAPYNSEGIRVSTSADYPADTGGVECHGYSYWSKINNHAGRDFLWVVAGIKTNPANLALVSPVLYKVSKINHSVQFMGAIFDPVNEPVLAITSIEMMYFDPVMPDMLIAMEAAAGRVVRADVSTVSHTVEDSYATIHEIFTVSDHHAGNWHIGHPHSSGDGKSHIVRLSSVPSYATVGAFLYREETGTQVEDFEYIDHTDYGMTTLLVPLIDKGGRWLAFLGSESSAEVVNIIDTEDNFSARKITDQQGAAGHAAMGYDAITNADNWGDANAWVYFDFLDADMDLVAPRPPSFTMDDWNLAAPSHASWEHARPRSEVPIAQQWVLGSAANGDSETGVMSSKWYANELIIFRPATLQSVDSQIMVVAPVMTKFGENYGGWDPSVGGTGAIYRQLPHAATDPTGEYASWTANRGTENLDLFIVKIPQVEGITIPGEYVPPDPPAGEYIEEATVWSSFVNSSALGATLTATSGSASARSTQESANGKTYMEVVVNESTLQGVVGLNATGGSTDYAWIFTGANIAEARMSAVYKADTPQADGDKFSILVEGTDVKFYKNDVLIHTDTQTDTYPLFLSASGMDSGLIYSAAKFGYTTAEEVPEDPDPLPSSEPVVWEDLVRATDTGGSLEATGDYASARSELALLSGDGEIEFVVPQNTAGFKIYLGSSAISEDYMLEAADGIAIMEMRLGGTYVSDTTYNPGDIFGIALVAGEVIFKKDRTPIYTIATTPSYPLYLYAYISSTGTGIDDVVYAGFGEEDPPEEPSLTWSDLAWTSVATMTIDGNDLTAAGSDSAAISTTSVTSGDVLIKVVPKQNNIITEMILDSSSGDDFLMNISSGGILEYNIGGVYAGDTTYVADDEIWFGLQEGDFVVYKNTVEVFREVGVSITYPFSIKANISTTGGKLFDTAISDGTIPEPPTEYEPLVASNTSFSVSFPIVTLTKQLPQKLEILTIPINVSMVDTEVRVNSVYRLDIEPMEMDIDISPVGMSEIFYQLISNIANFHRVRLDTNKTQRVPITRYRGDTYGEIFIFSNSEALYLGSQGFGGYQLILSVSTSANPVDESTIVFQSQGILLPQYSNMFGFPITDANADHVGDFFYEIEIRDPSFNRRTVVTGPFRMLQDIRKTL